MRVDTAVAGTELLTELGDESLLGVFYLCPVKCNVQSYG